MRCRLRKTGHFARWLANLGLPLPPMKMCTYASYPRSHLVTFRICLTSSKEETGDLVDGDDKIHSGAGVPQLNVKMNASIIPACLFEYKARGNLSCCEV